MKSWPPKKDVKSSDPNSRSCLVAVGRVFHVDTEDTDYSQLDEISEFETRQKADATFIRVDKRYCFIHRIIFICQNYCFCTEVLPKCIGLLVLKRVFYKTLKLFWPSTMAIPIFKTTFA